MLRVLGQNIPAGLPMQTGVLQADMTAFHLASNFGLILLPCNTFSMLSVSQRLSTLARVRQHLHPKGQFAASVPNPVLLRRLPRRAEAEVEQSFPHPIDGEPVQVSSAWERTSREFKLTWIYDHLLPDGRVERFTAQAHHTLAGVATYEEELSQAGLELVNRWGDFDGSPYEVGSPNYIFIARKRR